MPNPQPESFFSRIKLLGQPQANPANVIIFGQARFTVLTSRLVRLEWSVTGQFEDRSTFAFPTRFSEAISFQAECQEKTVTIQTEFLTLRYTDTGSLFEASNLSIALKFADRSVEWQPGIVNQGNLRGTRRTLDQCAAGAPLSEGLLSRDGWALFDDSGAIVWDRDQAWVEARPESSAQDWYFFGYGHDYKTALADYIKFGGAIPLIPLYVLGGWWSRFWHYSADDLTHLVQDFQSHDIPLDVLVVDMDWHTPVAWTGYSWNRDLFPDPAKFLAWVHSQGLHVTLNLHPAQGVQKHEDAYQPFAALIGHDTQSGKAITFTPGSKTFMQHYFELLHHPMEDQGVDFWWLDWQQGDASDMEGLDPLPWLNHLHFQDSTRRGFRPMLYSRWGGLGNHRYPIGFSGDTYATWESLRFQAYFTPTAANVAYGWWSHDIGGHFGATDPELYARWVQFGAVSPCLRLHSTKDPLAERRPWGFPEPVYEAAKAAFQFRYSLLPYLYSAARSISQQGLSLSYPMYYDFPEHEAAYLARDQYFLGDQMFVAPITQPADPQTGLATVDIWIPPGTWIEYSTHQSFTGPCWIREAGDLQRIPMFVKAGGIIPMTDHLHSTRDDDGSYLRLVVFPGDRGQFTLYQDDGLTHAYQHGDYETTLISLDTSDNHTHKLSIPAAEGYCSALVSTRSLDIVFQSINTPQHVRISGRSWADWRYDGENRALTIAIKEAKRNESFAVEVITTPIESAPPLVMDTPPFVHCLEYTDPTEAGQQSGTIVIVPAADGLSFEAQVQWTLFKDGILTETPPIKLTACTTEQILHSPFADQTDLHAYRWQVTVDIAWRDQAIHCAYGSKTLRPSINHWQAAIFNPAQQSLTIAEIITEQGVLNPALAWSAQKADSVLNLRQPYGVIFLENERERILKNEPLAACLVVTLNSLIDQNVVLYGQSAGAAHYYLNGIELEAVELATLPDMQPMFYSWMAVTRQCYRLPLQVGKNQLVIMTNPTPNSEWWGVGATVIDYYGTILT